MSAAIMEGHMSRRIITTSLHASGAAPTVDSYSDRVIKYIPADVVAAWVAAAGLIETAKNNANRPSNRVLWIVFGVGVVLAAAWTWKTTSKPGLPKPILQTAIATGAFVVWVFAVHGPFPD